MTARRAARQGGGSVTKRNAGLRRLKVASARNSMCASERLTRLDWTRWWTDGMSWGAGQYLHVAGEGQTWHRVFCRAASAPRLRMDNGTLYWLVDAPPADVRATAEGAE